MENKGKDLKEMSNKELDALYSVLVRNSESDENMRLAKEIEIIMLDRHDAYTSIKESKK